MILSWLTRYWHCSMLKVICSTDRIRIPIRLVRIGATAAGHILYRLLAERLKKQQDSVRKLLLLWCVYVYLCIALYSMIYIRSAPFSNSLFQTCSNPLCLFCLTVCICFMSSFHKRIDCLTDWLHDWLNNTTRCLHLRRTLKRRRLRQIRKMWCVFYAYFNVGSLLFRPVKRSVLWHCWFGLNKTLQRWYVGDGVIWLRLCNASEIPLSLRSALDVKTFQKKNKKNFKKRKKNVFYVYAFSPSPSSATAAESRTVWNSATLFLLLSRKLPLKQVPEIQIHCVPRCSSRHWSWEKMLTGRRHVVQICISVIVLLCAISTSDASPVRFVNVTPSDARNALDGNRDTAWNLTPQQTTAFFDATFDPPSTVSDSDYNLLICINMASK